LEFIWLLALSASREEKAVSPLRFATALQIIVARAQGWIVWSIAKIRQPLACGIYGNAPDDSFKAIVYDANIARQEFSVVVIKPSPFLVPESQTPEILTLNLDGRGSCATRQVILMSR
jgi:hypothetical protein